MGIKHAYLMNIVELSEEAINHAVKHQIREVEFNTFRISTKRQDKNFHLLSFVYSIIDIYLPAPA